MSDYDISRVLINHLKAMPNAPPIIEENSPNKPPSAAIFLVVYFMPTDMREPTYCGTEVRTGLLQVSVISRKKGTEDARQMADSIVSHFERFKSGGTVVTRRVAAQGQEQDGMYHIPVSIYYQSIKG